MASSLPTTASASVMAKISLNRSRIYSNVSFRGSPQLKFRSLSTSGVNCFTVIKAQLNDVAVPQANSEVPKIKANDSNETSPTLATEESISEFMAQVSSLVKLVDSRDIVELKLKQLDCELVIRKKEALPQPPTAAPFMMMHSPPPQALPAFQAAPPVAASAPPSPAPSATAAKPAAKSSLPPLKSPMAGTFYRSPAPGEPPFIKVGDKVQKGQVLCIIEAMKLMNEIEADQSGTIVEVVAPDGKPVSVDTPLFVIQP